MMLVILLLYSIYHTLILKLLLAQSRLLEKIADEGILLQLIFDATDLKTR